MLGGRNNRGETLGDCLQLHLPSLTWTKVRTVHAVCVPLTGRLLTPLPHSHLCSFPLYLSSYLPSLPSPFSPHLFNLILFPTFPLAFLSVHLLPPPSSLLSLLHCLLTPPPSLQCACPSALHSHCAAVWRNKVVVYGGLDSNDVPLSRLCMASVMVGGCVLGACSCESVKREECLSVPLCVCMSCVYLQDPSSVLFEEVKLAPSLPAR